jgi:hydroxyethylthiazole kinase-like uncharacterized protein yjeF
LKELTLKVVKPILKVRDVNSHKGTFGHALLIAGSKGMIGSAVIGAKACLRCGVGLLTVNIPEEERTILQIPVPEAMLSFRERIMELNLDKYSSIVIGPGIGLSLDSEILLKNVVKNCKVPLLIDADGLNLLAKNQDFIKLLPKNTILTPHPKEFDRLFGKNETTEERINTAKLKAKELNVVIVLKGHQTFIAAGNESFLNTTGNSGLAKAGSGDALSGIILSFLAQNYEALEAAKLGVFILGLAADLCLETQSFESMLITDVIENMGMAFKKISE